MKKESIKPKSRLRELVGILGPGLVTGAADDDPSGIATYSIAGAQLGTSLLWMTWFTWPLMGFVQMMCARIGMVTGAGLAAGLSQKFPKPVLVIVSIALLAANSINVGSDLSGMADAAELLTGVSSHIYVPLFAVGITIAIVQFRYHQIANVLKWLALVLCAYIVTAFLLKPDWGMVAKAFVVPEIRGTEAWATIVAILGTTISPYLFFWQSAQEVEEGKAKGQRTLVARKGASDTDLKNRMWDVGFGTLLSNVVMFFIILTTALTLNAHGITKISSSREAAEALRPLAGDLAMLLYTVGVIGVGFLAIPTLTGSAAYAFSDTFRWRAGLDEKFRRAWAFYAVVALSAAIGVAMDFMSINPLSALFWTSVINGVLAPFLLVGVLAVARDNKIMLGQPSSKLSQLVVFITILVMFGAAIAMFIF